MILWFFCFPYLGQCDIFWVCQVQKWTSTPLPFQVFPDFPMEKDLFGLGGWMRKSPIGPGSRGPSVRRGWLACQLGGELGSLLRDGCIAERLADWDWETQQFMVETCVKHNWDCETGQKWWIDIQHYLFVKCRQESNSNRVGVVLELLFGFPRCHQEFLKAESIVKMDLENFLLKLGEQLIAVCSFFAAQMLGPKMVVQRVRTVKVPTKALGLHEDEQAASDLMIFRPGFSRQISAILGNPRIVGSRFWWFYGLFYDFHDFDANVSVFWWLIQHLKIGCFGSGLDIVITFYRSWRLGRKWSAWGEAFFFDVFFVKQKVVQSFQTGILKSFIRKNLGKKQRKPVYWNSSPDSIFAARMAPIP